MFQRRSILMGLGAFVAAPAVVRAASIMSVRGIDRAILPEDQGAKDLVSFTIYGWDKLRLAEFRKSSSATFKNPPVAIRLSPSWRLCW